MFSGEPMIDILKLLGLRKRRVLPDPPVSTVGYHGGGLYGGALTVPWMRSGQRKKVEEDLVNMDENDGIVARIFDCLADYATCFEVDDFFGFKVVTGEEEGKKPTAEQTRATEIVNEMIERTELTGQSCWDIVRDMGRKGNVFAEVVVDDAREHIVDVKQFKHSWQIEKHIDNSGNLKSGDPAAAMRDPKLAEECAYSQVNEIGKVVAAFWPFQVVHWVFGHLAGGIYAEPLGAPGIVNWKRLNAGRDSLGIARVIRAWDSNIHQIPMPAGSTDQEVADNITRYRTANDSDEITTYDSTSGNFQTTPRRSPTNVARDLYVPVFYTAEGKIIPGDVKKLQPSTAALQYLDDIYFAMSVLICTFGIPIEILGLDIGSKPMVDKTKEEGMEAFSKKIKRLQFSHAIGLKTLFDIELLLTGFNPLDKLYKIKYPSIIPQTAETEAKIAMTKGQMGTYLWTMGMPPELIGPRLDFDSSQIDQWRQNLDKQMAAQQAIAKAQATQKATQGQGTPAQPQKTQPKPKDG